MCCTNAAAPGHDGAIEWAWLAREPRSAGWMADAMKAGAVALSNLHWWLFSLMTCSRVATGHEGSPLFLNDAAAEKSEIEKPEIAAATSAIIFMGA
jgi:hypothetical protein